MPSIRRSSQPRLTLAWALVLSLSVALFGWVGPSSSMAGPLGLEATLSAEERAEVDSVRAAFAATLAQLEAAFAAVDSLSPREIRLLRRSLNAAHVGAARRLGVVPVATDSALVAADGLGALDSDSPYYATWGTGRLAPDARVALDAIGERFHARLAARGLPAFRFVVSSTFRTAEHQHRLRGVNANAARSRSSHEYGTTFDLAYRRYRPAATRSALDAVPEAMPLLTRAWLAAQLDATEQAWAERMAAAYAGVLEAELGRALIELEDEGVLLALREVRQPCYHVTVARRLADA